MKIVMAASELNVSNLLNLAQKFNCFYLSGLRHGQCKPFIVEGLQVGLVRPDIVKHLVRYPEVFHVSGKCIELNPAFRDYRERTTRVANVLQQLKQDDCLSTLRGWRDECYAVSAPGYPDLFEMDRCATCLFGIQKYGVTINGYVKHPTKGLCIWFQQRSNSKQTWPGKWDNMVGGGLSVGFGILETAIKEAAEEASVPQSLANTMVPVGCVSFYFESERGLFPNTEYIYDMELPLDFIPDNSDGEVQSFELLTISECLEMIFSADFKTTSAPVVIDFLIRKGLITPDNEPNFVELVELLHIPLQTIYRWPFQQRQENGQPNSLHNNLNREHFVCKFPCLILLELA